MRWTCRGCWHGFRERQREIVRLISIEGEDVRTVAQRLGMSEVNVRVSLHRSLKALAALYRKGGA